MLTYDTPAYMFNVYKNQLSRQTESRNLTGPKTLPTICHTYMKLVTKYKISAIKKYSCWEKCDEKYIGTDRQTDRGKTVCPRPVGRGYKNKNMQNIHVTIRLPTSSCPSHRRWTIQSAWPFGICVNLMFPYIWIPIHYYTGTLEKYKLVNNTHICSRGHLF